MRERESVCERERESYLSFHEEDSSFRGTLLTKIRTFGPIRPI